MASTIAILVAAGSGDRLGLGVPKAFVEVGGRPLVLVAAEGVLRCSEVEGLVVAVPPGSEDRARSSLGGLPAEICAGGETRHASVAAALAAIGPAPDRVVCHDAARPFASPALFATVLAALGDLEGALPGVPVTDTVKRVRDGTVVATEPRDELVLAQTPQAFRGPALAHAHARAAGAALAFTDDAACLEWAGYRVGVVAGETSNFKITTLDDLHRAEALLAGAPDG